MLFSLVGGEDLADWISAEPEARAAWELKLLLAELAAEY